MSEIAEVDPRRSALQRGGRRGRGGGDFGWRLGGQLQFQFLQQEVEFGFGLGIAHLPLPGGLSCSVTPEYQFFTSRTALEKRAPRLG